MSWVSADQLFNTAEERAERELDAYHAEQLERARAEAERTRPRHLVDVWEDSLRRRRWRIECTCGWRASFVTEDEAREEAEWHV